MKYTLKIQESLLFAIKNSSKHLNHQILSFFDEKVCEMVAAEPNIKSVKYQKYERLKEVKNRVWVVRGYYPGTPIFFKLVVVEPDQDNLLVIPSTEQFYVKAIDPNKPKKLSISSDTIRNEVAECELLGHDMHIHTKRQRIMQPRGVKPCKYEFKKNV